MVMSSPPPPPLGACLLKSRGACCSRLTRRSSPRPSSSIHTNSHTSHDSPYAPARARLPIQAGVLFAPYKAILAEALASSCWTGSEEQIATLREGLGLTPAGEDFWGPLGEATKFLHPEDRVRLLVDFVRAFSGGEEMRRALLEVKDVLGPVRGGRAVC